MGFSLWMLPVALVFAVPVAILQATGVMGEWQGMKDGQELWDPCEPFFTLNTNMKDATFLQTALTNCGYRPDINNTTIKTAASPYRIYFNPTENAGFQAMFRGHADRNAAEAILTTLYEEYTRLVQQDVYVNLIKRATSAGLILESEDYQKDDSIVLTFLVME